MRLLCTALLSALISPCLSQSYLPGYKTAIAGENLVYHSPQPDADTSLLVQVRGF